MPDLRIAVLKEGAAGERRVAATPETVRKFAALGATMAVEAGAGAEASIPDQAYAEAGAALGDRAATIAGADLLLGIQGPDPASLSGAKPGAWLVAGLNPFGERQRIDAYAAQGLEALAMEFMPRITRAQSMDILSSQSNLAGYKAVLDAAAEYGRAFPMMMTAAGTISAARAFVMGVGVAGLQAIATARRLGAQVSATDVRAATKEQIESLGAKAIFVDSVKGIEGEGAGGYATEMSEEYKAAQAALVSSHIAKQDIVITTALIPGRPAPRLIADAQIATMKPGSVIVDLAVEAGGNVEGAVAGEVVERHGVRIVGHRNVPSRLATDASALFARNLYNFLSAFWDKEAGRPVLPDGDEIGDAIRLTRGGAVVNKRLLVNVPIDTLSFAEKFEGAGFGHDQARVLAAAFGQAQAAGREDLVTREYLDARLAEIKQAIAENGKEITGRLWSAVTIIAGVSTAISAVVGAAVALLLRSKGI